MCIFVFNLKRTLQADTFLILILQMRKLNSERLRNLPDITQPAVAKLIF